MIIDLRSDTITQPTAAMKEAMIRAQVGDDVFGEDPTVNQLQQKAAEMFGMEAGLYCSSGTQTNQIAISVHTRPGDEVICSDLAHVYLYEGGGIAQNSGASVRLIAGDRGRITANDVLRNINADDAHYPKSTLVCVENTMNKGGGAIYDMEELKKISDLCRSKGLKFHCDGARIFNALVASNTSSQEFGSLFDSISICLSKGLGAPVGSVLVGNKDFIYRAHRRRKNFGGGMRQAGFIAAAGLYALENNIERLKDDHRRATEIGIVLEKLDWVKGIFPVDTNIVIAEMEQGVKAADAMNALAGIGIRCFTFGDDKIRMVTHLDFHDEHLKLFTEKISKTNRDMITNSVSERIAGMY
ncbi:MAG: aminotransferase class I/II-fold pyridoxal phosphate-dependent enzyme [Flavobacteriales bacterium]|nr:aminotransferase class I/II-fold pyridoxal phosphate-dependent enzyme [Flavobacteriales bacterium]